MRVAVRSGVKAGSLKDIDKMVSSNPANSVNILTGNAEDNAELGQKTKCRDCTRGVWLGSCVIITI